MMNINQRKKGHFRTAIGAVAILSILPTYSLNAAIVVYPEKGQSQNQMAADKAKCGQWATQQTGIDPEALLSQSQQAAGQTPPSTGGGAVKGAGKGAAAGAIGGAIGGNAGKGAEIGAGVGAVGGAGRRAKQKEAGEQQQQQAQAQVQQQINTYEKAQKACLEGKGYSVS